MTFNHIARTSWWGPGPPVNNDGVTPRPYIGTFINGVAVHYTGGPKRARNYTQDPISLMREEQAWARSAGKSFEYNFKIFPRWDGSAAICEYAGLYQAAHAGESGKYQGNNSTRCAFQFAIGVDNHPSYSNYDPSRPTVWEPLTDSMIEAFQWKRAELIERGHVTTAVTPDQRLPGRQTSCPGEAVMGRWDELTALAPTEPDLPPEDDMTPFLWRDQRYANVFYVEAANAIAVDEATRDRALLAGAHLYVGRHDHMLQSCCAKAGIAVDQLKAIGS